MAGMEIIKCMWYPPPLWKSLINGPMIKNVISRDDQKSNFNTTWSGVSHQKHKHYSHRSGEYKKQEAYKAYMQHWQKL